MSHETRNGDIASSHTSRSSWWEQLLQFRWNHFWNSTFPIQCTATYHAAACRYDQWKACIFSLNQHFLLSLRLSRNNPATILQWHHPFLLYVCSFSMTKKMFLLELVWSCCYNIVRSLANLRRKKTNICSTCPTSLQPNPTHSLRPLRLTISVLKENCEG